MWLRKGRGMKVRKWLGALHSSHLQVAAILAQKRAGKHLSWKAVPVCSSHRCKSHTPAYQGEGGTGNPLLSRLHEVRRCVHSSSRCCCKMLASGQDCSMWACSHCLLNLGQSPSLSIYLFPMQIVNALTLRSSSIFSQKAFGLPKPCYAVETRAKL